MEISSLAYPTIAILRECSPLFASLQDERRQEILVLLYENGEMSVNALAEKMTISRSAVSHHLKQLLQIGVVAVRKDGRERHYSLSLEKIINLIGAFLSSLQDVQRQLEARK